MLGSFLVVQSVCAMESLPSELQKQIALFVVNGNQDIFKKGALFEKKESCSRDWSRLGYMIPQMNAYQDCEVSNKIPFIKWMELSSAQQHVIQKVVKTKVQEGAFCINEKSDLMFYGVGLNSYEQHALRSMPTFAYEAFLAHDEKLFIYPDFNLKKEQVLEDGAKMFASVIQCDAGVAVTTALPYVGMVLSKIPFVSTIMPYGGFIIYPNRVDNSFKIRSLY